MLLAGWMEHSSLATSWLSLDEGDRDGTQFWSGLIAALDVLAPGCGDEAVLRLRRHVAVPVVVEQLLEHLCVRSCPPSVIVLDDVHLVDADDEVGTSLGLFLHHVPPWLQSLCCRGAILSCRSTVCGPAVISARSASRNCGFLVTKRATCSHGWLPGCPPNRSMPRLTRSTAGPWACRWPPSLADLVAPRRSSPPARERVVGG